MTHIICDMSNRKNDMIGILMESFDEQCVVSLVDYIEFHIKPYIQMTVYINLNVEDSFSISKLAYTISSWQHNKHTFDTVSRSAVHDIVNLIAHF